MNELEIWREAKKEVECNWKETNEEHLNAILKQKYRLKFLLMFLRLKGYKKK